MISPGRSRKDNREKPAATKALPGRVQAGHDPGEAGADGWPVRTVVVDDSPVVLKTLCSFLELQNGFELVGTATDGRHAVRRVVEFEWWS
jgi:hypothetical protein